MNIINKIAITFISLAGLISISANWQAIGSGVANTSSYYTSVYALEIYNNELYIAGAFTSVDGVPALNIAKWNGFSWSPVGNGITLSTGFGIYSAVRCLKVYNGELYAGGQFTASGSTSLNNIAKWDGVSWTDVAGGLGSPSMMVLDLEVYNNKLIAGGNFSGPLTYNGLAQYDGASWTALKTGVFTASLTRGLVRDVTAYNGSLYIGGQFEKGDTVVSPNLIEWDGNNFIAVGTGANGSYGITRMFNDTNSLVVGGGFIDINGVAANNVAKLTSSWTAFSGGIGTPGGNSYEVQAFERHLGFLIVGGNFTGKVRKWDGFNFTAYGNGVFNGGGIGALKSYKGALIAAGSFTSIGSSPVYHLAQLGTIVGVNEAEDNNNIKLFPNPTNGNISITLANPNNNTFVEIKNLLGQLISTNTFNNNDLLKVTIDAPTGVYLVSVKSNNETTAVFKVIKN